MWRITTVDSEGAISSLHELPILLGLVWLGFDDAIYVSIDGQVTGYAFVVSYPDFFHVIHLLVAVLGKGLVEVCELLFLLAPLFALSSAETPDVLSRWYDSEGCVRRWQCAHRVLFDRIHGGRGVVKGAKLDDLRCTVLA